MAGRVESYLHSDSVTQNKGGALVSVGCETDFGSKTQEFVEFAQHVAKRAYGFQANTYKALAALDAETEALRVEVEKAIKEKVTVHEIKMMKMHEACTACACGR